MRHSASMSFHLWSDLGRGGGTEITITRSIYVRKLL